MAEQRRVAVVTGASRGIGQAVAQALLQAGYTVYTLCRSKPALEGMVYLPCDLSDSAQIDACFEEIFLREARIDLLVNNAGMGIAGPLETCANDDAAYLMQINVHACMHCCARALPAMRQQGQGRIVFISSLAAKFPIPFQAYYSASKAAIQVLAEALRMEVRPFGVEVATLCLGDVHTGFTDHRRKGQEDAVYGARMAHSVAKMEHDERNGLPPQTVARALMRMLKRRRLPQCRVVGLQYWLFWMLERLLPRRCVLAIVQRMYD